MSPICQHGLAQTQTRDNNPEIVIPTSSPHPKPRPDNLKEKHDYPHLNGLDRWLGHLLGENLAAMDAYKGSYMGMGENGMSYRQFEHLFNSYPEIREAFSPTGTMMRLAGTIPTGKYIAFMNSFTWENPALRTIVSSTVFYEVAFKLLDMSNYAASNLSDMVEVSGWFGLKANGTVVFRANPISSAATFNQGSVPPPPSGIGKVLGWIHTHPGSYIAYTEDGKGGAGFPSQADVNTSKQFGYPGLAVTGMQQVWGFDGQSKFPW